MLRHMHIRKLSLLSSSSTCCTLLPLPLPPSNSNSKGLLLPSLPSNSKPISKNLSFSLWSNGFSSIPYANVSASATAPVDSKDLDDRPSVTRSLEILKHKLKELGLDISACVPGRENRLLCPSCNGGKTKDISLSLFINQDGSSASWICFRTSCGWKGTTKAFADSKPSFESSTRAKKAKVKREITMESLQLEPLCNQLIAYFAERMISAETLKRNAVMQKKTGQEIAIAFLYWHKGAVINCKYRDIAKRRFWQEKDAEKIFYGLDDIEDASDIIIVEGEMDKLAMEEAGFRNCVSVPDGAPSSVSKKEVPPEEQDTRYQYLWNCKEYLLKASRIILATDGDPPGQALAEELARRLGRERCWRVRWPKKNDGNHFKDANEVLMNLGSNVLKDVIENAELYPIQGLFNFRDFFDEINSCYRTNGFEYGVSTDWKVLDGLYNVVPGELTIVTGVPNSGKSEWIDALLCNLNQSVGWKFALCSTENKVRDHARKLLEKYTRKPFFDSSYRGPVERMSVEELEEGKEWLSDTFYIIRCENDSLPSIDAVLDLAREAVLRHGVQGLVIDPYNELNHQHSSSQTKTEYVTRMLTKIKRFAEHHSCHVWFVGHPKQLHHCIGAPPNLHDISGSASFIKKCDNGINIIFMARKMNMVN